MADSRGASADVVEQRRTRINSRVVCEAVDVGEAW